MYCDLDLQVQGCRTIQDSLEALTTFEDLNEGNQYFCENCQSKQDAKRGAKLKSIPPILTIALRRFTYDFERDERVKLTGQYEYSLEVDMGPYTIDGESNIYELFAVVIHRGSAF